MQLEKVASHPGPGLVVAFSCNQFSREELTDSKKKKEIVCKSA